ncbi:MAG: transposase, partial [Desulfobacterales bacterium]|nr:transposase [Desulfobacterales bacterium]
MKIINDAVDHVRKEERKQRAELKHSRYVWLKNPTNLKVSQSELLAKLSLKGLNLKTVRAYHIRLNFQELWHQPLDQAEAFLKKWYFWATHSRLQPMIDAARTIQTPLAGSAALVHLSDQQRHPGGHQQPRASRQSPGPRLPLRSQLHHHDLSVSG